jgi:hypothetical protein
VDMVISNWQHRVIKAIQEKTEKAIKLYENLVENVNNEYKEEIKNEYEKVELPKFLLS